jgi:hypothetical protein
MKRIAICKVLLWVLPLTLTLSSHSFAEEAAKPEVQGDAAVDVTVEETPEAPEEEKPKTIAELTEEADRFDGLFTVFQDSETGATKLLVRGDQVGQEFIYFKHIMNGVTDAGAFTGSYGDNFVFTIERRFDEL